MPATIFEQLEGRTVDGRFPLLERLGGSQELGVFLTVRQGVQRTVIKLHPADTPEADQALARWQAAASLSHPHLAKIFGAGRGVIERIPFVYVLTEYADQTLSRVLAERPLGVEETRRTADAILSALSYLHARGIVHGHVRPRNILRVSEVVKLTADELLVAGDGGPVRIDPEPGDAPEIMSGEPTAAVDIWSVGVMLAELLTGRQPTVSADGSFAPPETLPRPFSGIVGECLSLDPGSRPALERVRERLELDTNPLGAVQPVRSSSGPGSGPDSGSAPRRAGLRAGLSSSEIPTSLPDELLASLRSRPGQGEIATPRSARATEPTPPPGEGAESTVTPTPGEEADPPELTPSFALFSDYDEPRRFHLTPLVLGLVVLLALAGVLVMRNQRELTAVHRVGAPALDSGRGPNPSAPVRSPSPTPPQTEASVSHPAPVRPAGTAPSPTPSGPRAGSGAEGGNRGAVLRMSLPRLARSATLGLPRPLEVTVRVSVSRRGEVSHVAFVSPGIGSYFARAAWRAAWRWLFRPPRRDGHAEESVWHLHFTVYPTRTEAHATLSEH